MVKAIHEALSSDLFIHVIYYAVHVAESWTTNLVSQKYCITEEKIQNNYQNLVHGNEWYLLSLFVPRFIDCTVCSANMAFCTGWCLNDCFVYKSCMYSNTSWVHVLKNCTSKTISQLKKCWHTVCLITHCKWPDTIYCNVPFFKFRGQ